MIETIGMINNVSVYSAKGCVITADYAQTSEYGIIITALAIGIVLFMFAWVLTATKYDKRKRFMVRKNLENEYEQWLHDRRAD